MIDLIKDLCLIDAVSGNEKTIIKKIISLLPKTCTYKTDAQNNLIVFKKGKKVPQNKLLLTAHMDEVGLIVTNVLDDGSLAFDTIGDVDAGCLAGTYVKSGETYGVVNVKPIHLQDGEERKEKLKLSDLSIDIGALSKAEALKVVEPGENFCFWSDFINMGDQKIKCKAIDDRFGCAVLIKILCEYDEYDVTCAFLSKEEIGSIGAKTAAFDVEPYYSVVFDVTTALDLPDIEDENQICKLDCGPVVPFMDKGTIYDKELYNLSLEVAEKNRIKIQTTTAIIGANDAEVISSSKTGVKTISVNLPCRYTHSSSSVASTKDINDSLNFSKLLIDAIYSL